MRKRDCNVPTFRFDFDGIWNKIHLYEITNKVSRKAPVNSTAPIRMISYGNGFILQSDKYSRDNAGESLKKYTLLKKGEMAYNHGASKNKKYGVCYSLKESDEARIPFVYHAFQINRGLPAFWNYALNISQIDKQLKKLVSSGARMDGLLNISYDDYMSISVYEPCVDEQAKISAFLSVIDKRIAVQNKIISKYETLIKGLCDMIFSSIEGNILPLKAIASIEKGQQINGMSLAKTGKYYYLNGGIAPSGYIDDYNTSEETISISEGGNSCGFVSYNIQKFWSGGHCYTLKIITEQCRSKYLFFYLKYKEKDIMQLRVGSGLPNIHKKSLENFNVKLPNYKKQCFVERILEVITAKKEIENALLERFQSQKKFLLSKMFI